VTIKAPCRLSSEKHQNENFLQRRHSSFPLSLANLAAGIRVVPVFPLLPRTLAAERQVRDFLIGPRNKKQRKKIQHSAAMFVRDRQAYTGVYLNMEKLLFHRC
jgi:hypothetical protein